MLSNWHAEENLLKNIKTVKLIKIEYIMNAVSKNQKLKTVKTMINVEHGLMGC